MRIYDLYTLLYYTTCTLIITIIQLPMASIILLFHCSNVNVQNMRITVLPLIRHAFDRICWLLYIFCSPQWFFLWWFRGFYGFYGLLGMTAARHSDSDDLTLRTTMIGLPFTPLFVCLVDCLSVRLFFIWWCLAVFYGLIDARSVVFRLFFV